MKCKIMYGYNIFLTKKIKTKKKIKNKTEINK